MGLLNLLLDWIKLNPLKAVAFAAVVWWVWKRR